MFIGTNEEQKALSQHLLEAVVYLKRASTSLTAVIPMYSKTEDSRETTAKRANIDSIATQLESQFHTLAREVFRGGQT